MKLQIVSYFQKKETISEYNSLYKKDRIKQTQVFISQQLSKDGHISKSLSCL